MKNQYQEIFDRYITEINDVLSGKMKSKNICTSSNKNDILAIYISSDIKDSYCSTIGIGITGITFSDNHSFRTIHTNKLSTEMSEEEFFSHSTSMDFLVNYESFTKLRTIQNKMINGDYDEFLQ